jgi:hypothetical protein
MLFSCDFLGDFQMRSFFYCLVAVAVCASQSVFGSVNISPSTLPVAGDYIDFQSGSFRTGTGGPFLGRLGSTAAQLNSASNTNTWFTFCVESGTQSTTENITFNTDYRVASVSQYVAAATGNVVTDAARFLYYAYGHDMLGTALLPFAGYTGTAAQNADLQEVIWSLIVRGDRTSLGVNDYSTAYPVNGNDYWLATGTLSALQTTLRNAAIAAVTTAADAAANVAIAGRIMIVNPDNTFPGDNAQAQSMLFEVPEPATIAVWSILGLLGIGASRRFAK